MNGSRELVLWAGRVGLGRKLAIVLGIFAALSGVDQLPGVADLLRGQFRLAPEFHAPALRGLHSGAGSFAY